MMFASFITNTTGVTSETGTLSQNLMSSPELSEVSVAQSFVFCVIFCKPFFVVFVFVGLTMVLYDLLRFNTSDYPHLVYSISHKSYNSLYWI